MHRVDVIVVGQGLAGTALAWQLLRRGRSVLVLDREPPVTSSRIAAGLLTPITGKRLAVSWRWDEFLPVATAFYRQIESQLGVTFFHSLPCVRLFAYEIELKQYAKSTEEFAGLACEPDPPVDPDWFDAPRGAFQMPTAARLDTATYLDASRDHFRKIGAYRTASVDVANDLAVSADEVRVPPLGVSASRLVFCQGFDQGFDGAVNPYFPDVVFNAAKGEILTLRIPGLAETRVMNRGVWLAPGVGDTEVDGLLSAPPHPPPSPSAPFGDLPHRGGGVGWPVIPPLQNKGKGPTSPLVGEVGAANEVRHAGWGGTNYTRERVGPIRDEYWRCGATYSWDPLDCVPTAEGREQILTRLRAFLKLPVEVVAHAAAVRPIIDDRHPVIRWNAAHPRIGFFNGLGSKGSLLSPYFAGVCADECVA